MTLPAWARRNARCVCIDDAWTDVDTGLPTKAARPVKGSHYTIMLTEALGHAGYLVISGVGVGPDLWSVDAFRPLTAKESDTEMFEKLLKGASVAPQRELEPTR